VDRGTDSRRTDGRTDTTRLIVAFFAMFANAPRNLSLNTFLHVHKSAPVNLMNYNVFKDSGN
jgi:hypothetical protein